VVKEPIAVVEPRNIKGLDESAYEWPYRHQKKEVGTTQYIQRFKTLFHLFLMRSI
jgi:hypothetical protein